MISLVFPKGVRIYSADVQPDSARLTFANEQSFETFSDANFAEIMRCVSRESSDVEMRPILYLTER